MKITREILQNLNQNNVQIIFIEIIEINKAVNSI